MSMLAGVLLGTVSMLAYLGQVAAPIAVGTVVVVSVLAAVRYGPRE